MDTDAIIETLRSIGWTRYSSVPVDYEKASTFAIRFIKQNYREFCIDYCVQKIGVRTIGLNFYSKEDGFIYTSTVSLPNYFDNSYLQSLVERMETSLFVEKLRYSEKVEHEAKINKLLDQIS
jgi:hypothetical protein